MKSFNKYIEIDCVAHDGNTEVSKKNIIQDIKSKGLKGKVVKSKFKNIDFHVKITGDKEILRKWLIKNQYEYESDNL